jgi:pfkB family carbohydrate kinase
VIVVVGRPAGRVNDGVITAGGAVSRVALAAAAAGRSVQLVGKIGDDPAADAIVLDLARHGVDHAALLRDPTWTTSIEQDPEQEGGPIPWDDAPAADRPAGSVPAASGSRLDPADVELGLRYLTDFRVVVVAEASPVEVIAVAAEAARWDASRLILVTDPQGDIPADLPDDAIVLEAPDSDPDGVFADLVGTLAAGLDGPAEPGEAFRASIAVDGWAGGAAD